MKQALFFCLALLVTLLPLSASAAEESYTAKFTGIDCNGCKKTISRALGKIKGVKTIRIVKGSGDQHLATVITDGSKQISQGDAASVLGKGNHFTLVGWSKN